MSSTGRSDVRKELDYYGTPGWAARAIFPFVPLNGRILEPSAGEGAIVETLIAHGVDRERITAIEIDPGRAERCQGRTGVVTHCADFLTWADPTPYDLVIGNPPFVEAQAFVEASLKLTEPVGGTVAMLLRGGFLESKGRVRFHRAHPSDLYVFAKRPIFIVGTQGDSAVYGWFKWAPGCGGRWEVLDCTDGQMDMFGDDT